MCDDLANQWGRNLVIEEGSSLTRRAPTSNTMYTTKMPHLVRKDVPNFHLAIIVGTGSAANLWSINEATHGFGVSSCLIASGSYLAGDGGYLEQLSTSVFDPGNGLCFVADPNESKGRKQTIPLPYHIPGECSSEALSTLETECFEELHMRCVLARMSRRPYKAILLELMLAGNGASLNDTALEKLASLAKLHDLAIIVDEIMTAGRSSKTSMLLTASKPTSFQAAVSYVTMGKWTNAGIVLRNNSVPKNDKTQSRGVTVPVATKVTENIWPVVVTLRAKLDARRAEVLKKLKVKEEDCWGVGLLIFAPVARRDSQPGLKSRFLPLANAAKFDIAGLNRENAASRADVNALVVQGVRTWLRFSKQNVGEPISRHFCNILMASKAPFLPVAQLNQALLEHQFKRTDIKRCIADAEEVKYIVKAQKTKKRIRVVCINQVLMIPK
jgi:hypothetical protein